MHSCRKIVLTAGFKCSWRKTEVAEDRAGWRQTVCDLCSNESDKANQLNSLTVFTKHLHLGPKKISVLPVAVW